MMENPEPDDWEELQAGVCRIFTEIGLQAEQNKKVRTPRGEVSLDVFAIDPGSVDKIQYVVECKNWNSSVPQSVVHSFTTVMQEVGANIGYLVSKHGFQKGAIEYLRNKNIRGVTYADYQNHYLGVWIDRHFCPTVGGAADSLIQYTEPINSRRERCVANLSPDRQRHFLNLHKRYNLFGMAMAMISARQLMPQVVTRPYISIEKMNKIIGESLSREHRIDAPYLNDFLKELVRLIQKISGEFIDIFEGDIFAQQVHMDKPQIYIDNFHKPL